MAAFWAAIGSAGCQALSKSFGIPNPFEVTRPYEGRHRNPLAVKGITRAASVVVFPVANLPSGWGYWLARDLERAAQARDIPVFVRDGAETADQLMGRAAIRERADGAYIEVTWQYLDAEGTFLSDFTVTEPLDDRATTGGLPLRERLNQRNVTAVAERSADRLQDLLEEAQGRDPEHDMVRSRVVLRPVTGAPGSNGRTLTRVLARILSEARFDVDTRWQAEDDSVPRGAIIVLGEVQVTQIDPVVDQVVLTWTVLDHKGRRMGQIQQSNRVPSGRLDRPWGDIALMAAQGAAEGILGLLANMPTHRG